MPPWQLRPNETLPRRGSRSSCSFTRQISAELLFIKAGTVPIFKCACGRINEIGTTAFRKWDPITFSVQRSAFSVQRSAFNVQALGAG